MLIFLNQICILASFNDVLTISVRFESPLHFTENVLFATTSYTKMFGSDERLIQFWLSLYLMLLFTRTPFKLISEQFTEQYAIINQACCTRLDSLVIQPQDFIYMLTCPDTFQTHELHKGRDSYLMVTIYIFTPPPFLNNSSHSGLNSPSPNCSSITHLISIDQSSFNPSIPPHLSQCSPFLSFVFTFQSRIQSVHS